MTIETTNIGVGVNIEFPQRKYDIYSDPNIHRSQDEYVMFVLEKANILYSSYGIRSGEGNP